MAFGYVRGHRLALKGGTALLLAHLALGVAPALSQTWDGDTNTNWTEGTNWNPDVAPGIGDNATIDGQGGLNQPRIFGGDNITINGLTHSAGTLTIDAGASLTTAGGYVLSGTGQLVSAGTVFGTFTVQGGTATLSGALDGSLTITGGTVTNSGSVSGATSIFGGTLNLNAGTNLSDTQTLDVIGGTVNLNASDTVGALAGVSGTINLANGQILTAGGSNANTTFSGVLAGQGGLTKTGTGALGLSGANTYTGATQISAGTLAINGAGSLGATTVTNDALFEVINGATAGTSTIINNRTLVFNNAGSAGSATITTNDGAALNARGTLFFGLSTGGTSRQIVNAGGLLDITQHAGAGVTIGSLEGAGLVGIGGKTLTIGSNNNSTTFSGVIQNQGNQAGSAALAGDLVKTGTGTLTLSGANTYTGTTTINEGVLNIQNAAGLGSTAAGTTVAAGAALELQGGINIGTEALTLNGTGVANGGALRSIGGNNTVGGAITLGSASRINADANLLNLQSIDNGGFLLTLGGAGITIVNGAISGAGGLTMDGGDTVALRADNTYAGITTINAGTLNIGGGGAAGSLGTGNVVNNAALIINRTGVSTYAGVISGTGTLTKQGAGTFTLTGAHTYTGATTIDNGTLVIDGTGALGATTVTNNAGLQFFNNSSAGNATITSAGPNGNTAFFGNSSAANATIVNNQFLNFIDSSTAGQANITNNNQMTFFNTSTAGNSTITNNDQLQLLDTGSLGNAQITNNATIDFQDSSTAGSATITTTAGGAINGQGTRFRNNSTGGTSGHIVNAGGLLDITQHIGAGVTIGSLAGAGTVAVGGKTLGVGTNNASTTFSGVIQNLGNQAGSGAAAGGLTKVGTGTLTLTGASTYTGPTQVDAGTLIVNGSLLSPVTIGAAGTFGGAGTIPQLTVNGTLSPGNSPGTLNVNGNVLFGPASIYFAEIEGAQADRINATGTATLAGTLRLVPLGGTYLFNTPYTLLRAQGGRTGTFGTVNTQGSFGAGITSAVAYTGTDVNLTLTPAPLVPVLAGPAAFGIAAPGNVAAVASGFDAALASGANLDAFFPLYNQSAANLPGALNTFTGEVHTAASAMGFDVQGRFLGNMLDPFALGRRGNNAAAGTPAFYAAEQLASQRYASDLGPLGRMGRTNLDVPMPDPRYTVWGSVFGATGHVDGSAGAGSAKRDTDHAGLAVGGDYRFNRNAAIGFAVSGAQASSSLANGLGSSEADAFQAGLYGMGRMGDVSFGVSAAYTWLDVEARRTVPVLGFQPLSGHYDAHGLGVRAEAAWAAFRTAGLTISPTAAIQAQSIRTDAFTETAAPGAAVGVAALNVNGRTSNAARTELGLRLDAAFRTGTTDVTAFASVAWAHYLERDMTMSASIAALPAAAFTVTGAQRDRDAALVGLGLDIAFTRAVSLTARADGAFSANASEIGGSATLRVRF